MNRSPRPISALVTLTAAIACGACSGEDSSSASSPVPSSDTTVPQQPVTDGATVTPLGEPTTPVAVPGGVSPGPGVTAGPVIPTTPSSTPSSGGTGPAMAPQTTTEPVASGPVDGPSPNNPPPSTDGAPSLIGDVAFSVPSGTFEGQLSVALTGPDGAEIRYTTDGTLPTASSTLYDGTALTLTETTQLRAAAFAGGMASGFPSTAIYIARTFDLPSDVPIVIMDGYGGGRPEKEVTFNFGGADEEQPYVPQEFLDVAFMLFEPVDGVASIANAPTIATRAGYHERGQSSANAEKSPYRVEFWDNYDEDSNYPVLGMPAEADWAMIGEYFDRSLIQNPVVYGWGEQMGLVTMEVRFAELYINFDGGPLEQSDYFGLYMISETIKNQKDRVDLKQLREDDTMLPDISGGYIFKFDQAALDGGEAKLICTGSEPFGRAGGFGGGGFGMSMDDEPATDVEPGHCWNDLGVVDPFPANDQQVTWLTDYVQNFHDAIHTEPMGDYAQYIDVASFVDHVIINEITRDVDAYVRSSFFHKERDGLIKAGPLWDYNLAMASTTADFEGWHFESQATGRGNDDWFLKLGQDPAFMAQFATRWRELRESFLSDAAIDEQITAIATPLAGAGQRDMERWPAAGLGGGFGFGGGGRDEPAEEPEAPVWLDQVTTLREWIPQRMAWIDSAIVGL